MAPLLRQQRHYQHFHRRYLSRSRYVYVKSKKVRGDVERRGWKVGVGGGEGGGGGLTYRGLTSSRLTRRCPSELLLHGEYTSASPRFCPREKSLLLESSEMMSLPKRFLRSNFRTIFFYLSLYQTISICFTRPFDYSFAFSRCGNTQSATYSKINFTDYEN